MQKETIERRIAFLEREHQKISDIVAKLEDELDNAKDDLMDIEEELNDFKFIAAADK